MPAGKQAGDSHAGQGRLTEEHAIATLDQLLGRARGGLESFGQLVHLVAVAHPHIKPLVELPENQVLARDLDARGSELADRTGLHVAAQNLRGKLRDLTGKAIKLDVEEISQPDVDAQLVAENIAGQLERRISHGRAMKRAVMQAMRQGALRAITSMESGMTEPGPVHSMMASG